MTTRNVTAERLYTAFSSAMPMPIMAWSKLKDHKPWFALANEADAIAAAPTDVIEPFDFDLSVPIEPLVTEEGTVVRDNDIPTSLHIRAPRASDLCHREFVSAGTEAFNNAIHAQVYGVDKTMLGSRVALEDAEAASTLVVNATGVNAWMVMATLFINAGGVVLDAHGNETDSSADAWRACAYALLTTKSTERGGVFTLRCRTAGTDTLTVGPLRVLHTQTHEDVSVAKTEWRGRLDALSVACGVDVGVINGLRVEDAARAWACFEELKKKAELAAASKVSVRLSSLSTDGPQTPSPTSPSTS